mgnify:CR=1 FL=1|tara:strand:+ start:10843 stop:11754 length:912 start_codon:yes stop_codon:yes gene_type:complete
MIFNETLIGRHPAESGYIVECLVKGSELIDPNVGFVSGSGRLEIEFPKFAVSNLTFEGKNLLTEPASSMDAIEQIVDFVNIQATFSGDLDTIGDTLGTQNVKNADVYTGSDRNFSVDLINHSNRILQFPMQLSPGEITFPIQVSRNDLTGFNGVPDATKLNQNIYYKVVPTDYLTFGTASAAVSGEMFDGFPDANLFSSPFTISRTNANDLFVDREGILMGIATPNLVIEIDNTPPNDFAGDFIFRTNCNLTITGISGATITTSLPEEDFPLVDNAIVTSGSEDTEFTIESKGGLGGRSFNLR